MRGLLKVYNHDVKSVQIRSFFWSVFSCIRTEYGNLRSKSPYSVRIQKNTDQKKKTPYLDEFSRRVTLPKKQSIVSLFRWVLRNFRNIFFNNYLRAPAFKCNEVLKNTPFALFNFIKPSGQSMKLEGWLYHGYFLVNINTFLNTCKPLLTFRNLRLSCLEIRWKISTEMSHKPELLQKYFNFYHK